MVVITKNVMEKDARIVLIYISLFLHYQALKVAMSSHFLILRTLGT
ncbi:MAG: hypothetical protein WHT65_08035 [Pseudothermotoga sp.]